VSVPAQALAPVVPLAEERVAIPQMFASRMSI
jgi:hypothetical protein